MLYTAVFTYTASSNVEIAAFTYMMFTSSLYTAQNEFWIDIHADEVIRMDYLKLYDPNCPGVFKQAHDIRLLRQYDGLLGGLLTYELRRIIIMRMK